MTTIHPLDAVTAGLGAAGTAIQRVDTDRLAELAADLAESDLAASVASSAATAVELMNEQVATILEHGRHTSRNARIAVGVGVVGLVAVGVIVIRRRQRSRVAYDTNSSDTAV